MPDRKAFVLYDDIFCVCLVRADSEEQALLAMARWWFDVAGPIELPEMPPGRSPDDAEVTRLDLDYWDQTVKLDDLCHWDEHTPAKRKKLQSKFGKMYTEAQNPVLSPEEAELARVEAMIAEQAAKMARLDAAIVAFKATLKAA